MVQLLISEFLFCGLFLLTSSRELGTDRESSLLFFAIGSFGLATTLFAEFLTRDPAERSLSGIGKARKSAICYRQIVFVMIAIFASLIFCAERSASSLLPPFFAVAVSLWLVWSNLVGYRMLHRRLYRPARADPYPNKAESVSLPAARWSRIATRR